MVRAQTEEVALHEEASMAVEDQVQAAVERHVAAACTGHAQQLENMRLQMQQSLDARAEVMPDHISPQATSMCVCCINCCQAVDHIDWCWLSRVSPAGYATSVYECVGSTAG